MAIAFMQVFEHTASEQAHSSTGYEASVRRMGNCPVMTLSTSISTIETCCVLTIG